jgi:hypothetical protein
VPWRSYTGTQPETADTDKGTLKVLIDSSSTRRAKPTIKRDLIDLLHGQRSVYSVPKAIGLDEALNLTGDDTADLRFAIKQLAPLTDLKPLLRRWDKHLSPAPPTRKGYAERLLALLDGAAPTPEPIRASRSRRRRAA